MGAAELEWPKKVDTEIQLQSDQQKHIPQQDSAKRSMDKEILDTSEEQKLEDMIDRNLSQHMNQPLEDDLLPNYGDKSNSVVVEVVDERSSSTSGPETVPPNVENDKQEVENRIDSS